MRSGFRCHKAELRAASTIPVHYVQWLLGSEILGSPRQLFAFARDGLLPRVLGQLHPRSYGPYVAILCYSTIAVVPALTGTFAELVVLFLGSAAVIGISSMLALIALDSRQKIVGLAALIGLSILLYLIQTRIALAHPFNSRAFADGGRVGM
jgi:basic amino acid/polyamine antiporter, APA family